MTATKIEQKFLGKSHRNNKRQSANLLDCRRNEFQKKKKKKQFKFVIVLCVSVLSCEKVVPNADLKP